MSTLHLITRPPNDEQLTMLLNPEDDVVVLSEAVYHTTAISNSLEQVNWTKRTKVLEPDLQLRGLENNSSMTLISYPVLVELTLNAERTLTW